MLNKEEIKLMYIDILQKIKFFGELDDTYSEYLNGCADTLEKILDIKEIIPLKIIHLKLTGCPDWPFHFQYLISPTSLLIMMCWCRGHHPTP